MEACEQKKFEELVKNIFMLWNPEEIRHYIELILWQQSTEYIEDCKELKYKLDAQRINDMLQLKDSQFSWKKSNEDFENVDGRIKLKEIKQI